MDPVEIRCMVRGIFATASLETDQTERDIRCFRAIMKEPIASMICISTDAEVLIDDLIKTCYGGDIKRLLAAALVTPEASHYHFQAQMRAQLYEVSLKKLQQIASPTISDLAVACAVYHKISDDKRGGARSLVRRFAKEIGTCRAIDEFMDSLEAPGIQDIIASALIEAKGALQIWTYIRPAFREGYKGFDAWCEAERTKTQIEILVRMESTPQIEQTILNAIESLNENYMDPFGGNRWMRETPICAEWCKRHIDHR